MVCVCVKVDECECEGGGLTGGRRKEKDNTIK